MTNLSLSKATNEQLMTILRHDYSIPNDLLKQVLEESMNRGLLKGYAIKGITKYFGDIHEAEKRFNATLDDFIQIAYMAILKAADTFREGKAGFTTWFVIPIKGALHRYVRDNTAQKRVATVISIDTPLHDDITLEDMLPSKESVEKQVLRKIEVEELLRKIDNVRQDILWLYTQGYTFPEIAKEKGISSQRAHFLYHQSIKRLKGQIA